jgi:hypothetical protein
MHKLKDGKKLRIGGRGDELTLLFGDVADDDWWDAAHWTGSRGLGRVAEWERNNQYMNLLGPNRVVQVPQFTT